MNRTTHIVAGTCAGVIMSTIVVSNPLSVEGAILSSVLIGGSIWGSLLPDIDHPESTFGKKVPFISNLISATGGHRGITHAPLLYMLLLSLMLLITNKGIQFFVVLGFEHFISKIIARLIYKLKLKFLGKPYYLHWALYLIMIVLTCKFDEYLNILYIQMLIGAFVGALSHIFMDSLTTVGTPWLYPITKRKFRILKLKTGKDEGLGILIALMITVVTVYLIRFR